MSNIIKYPNKIQKEVAFKKSKEINIKKANLGEPNAAVIW